MVTRNHDSVSFALGLTAGILAVISLLFTCIGDGLPSWYVGTNANDTVIVAEANLFYACFASNVSQSAVSPTLTCTSYNSYSCSTASYQYTVLNVTAYLSGCINPGNGSSQYLGYDGPIYQVFIDDFYNLRSAAALSIVSILFILFSSIFAFLTGIILLNIYLVFLAPILACIAVIFGACCLVTAGSALNYTGAGFALFTVGILLEVIVTLLLAIIAGRLNIMERKDDERDGEPIFTRRGNSPMVIRRVLKRRV